MLRRFTLFREMQSLLSIDGYDRDMEQNFTKKIASFPCDDVMWILTFTEGCFGKYLHSINQIVFHYSLQKSFSSEVYRWRKRDTNEGYSKFGPSRVIAFGSILFMQFSNHSPNFTKILRTSLEKLFLKNFIWKNKALAKDYYTKLSLVNFTRALIESWSRRIKTLHTLWKSYVKNFHTVTSAAFFHRFLRVPGCLTQGGKNRIAIVVNRC